MNYIEKKRDKTKPDVQAYLDKHLFILFNWFRKWPWFRHSIISLSGVGILLILFIHLIHFAFLPWGWINFQQLPTLFGWTSRETRIFINYTGIYLTFIAWAVHHGLMFGLIIQINGIKKKLNIKSKSKKSPNKYDMLPT